MEMAGVAEKVPMPKERKEVKEVTVIAEPASSKLRAILRSGHWFRLVSCQAPSITYVSSTPMANARNGTTVTYTRKCEIIIFLQQTWWMKGTPNMISSPAELPMANEEENKPSSASNGFPVMQSPVMLKPLTWIVFEETFFCLACHEQTVNVISKRIVIEIKGSVYVVFFCISVFRMANENSEDWSKWERSANAWRRAFSTATPTSSAVYFIWKRKLL